MKFKYCPICGGDTIVYDGLTGSGALPEIIFGVQWWTCAKCKIDIKVSTKDSDSFYHPCTECQDQHTCEKWQGQDKSVSYPELCNAPCEGYNPYRITHCDVCGKELDEVRYEWLIHFDHFEKGKQYACSVGCKNKGIAQDELDFRAYLDDKYRV